MNILWLSANRLGYELLRTAQQALPGAVTGVITLAPDAKTVMYDGVPDTDWDGFGLPVHRISRIEAEADLLRRLAPDLVVSCGWRQMIPAEILTIPAEGFAGFHPTLLPQGRGPAPIINSIMQDITDTGLTLFYYADGTDNGDIIGQAPFTIGPDDHAGEVYENVITAGRVLIRTFLPRLAAGTAPRIPQDDETATVFRPLPKDFNRLDPSAPREENLKKIRALSKPYRGAYIERNGKKNTIWRTGDYNAA